MASGGYDLCPACGVGRIVITQSREEIPHIGPSVLIVARCTRCRYRYNDIVYLEEREPTCYSFKVTCVEDLKVRVVRSSTGYIRIPELGAEVTPGPRSESYVSNVEGVLDRFEEAIRSLITLTPSERVRAKQRICLERVRKAREGKIPFTLIIKDPRGTSAILPQNDKKIKKRRLSRREIEMLMRHKRL